MSSDGFIPLDWNEVAPDEMLKRAKQLFAQMDARRTTRHFSTRDVPKELIELAIKSASTAPSGAHLQPWKFIAVSNSEIKQKMRDAAEIEERKTYLATSSFLTSIFFNLGLHFASQIEAPKADILSCFPLYR